jgi:hypothetical protein
MINKIINIYTDGSYVKKDGKIYKIINLHIHSKKTDKFLFNHYNDC